MAPAIPISVARPQRPEIIESKNASDRYEQAYLHAGSMEEAGNVIQTVGWMLGIFIFCCAVFSAHTAVTPNTPLTDWLTPGGLMIGAIVTGFLFWLVGALVSARGEVLKASLDCAVNSSPFLSDAQRAKVMSLS